MADELPSFRQRVAARILGDTGTTVVEESRLQVLEAASQDRRMMERDLENLAMTALNESGAQDQDISHTKRRAIVKQIRAAWRSDPQLGGITDLYNDFCLGRGVPMAKARDPKVQEVIDDAWKDEDNRLVLTDYEAQMALNTDLTLQCNFFYLAFFEGDDGKVKLTVLDHDSVEQIVGDDNNRRRHLWYIAREPQVKWDYTTHTSKALPRRGPDDGIKYYAHWENSAPGQKPEASVIGKGKVKHIALNKTGEMAFGHPMFHRVLRWSNAFNTFMTARVDMAQAAAAFYMKRKVKGTRGQVEKLATQALSRRSHLAQYVDVDGTQEVQGGRPAGIMSENEGVEHEVFPNDSGSASANVDGQMIKGQVSAGGHFPLHYLGDVGSANLATATSMELPVLKAIESRQEILEGIFRWFFDLVIETAIKKGKLSKYLSDEEMAERQAEQEKEGTDDAPPQPTPQAGSSDNGGAPDPEMAAQEAAEDALALDTGPEAMEDPDVDTEGEDEERLRDLAYDFSLPSPLRRLLTDLVTSVSGIARTFDPNGTNIELSRTLLAVVLGEGLEMSDPAEVVEKVFPPGYKDPAMAALEAQQPPPGGAPGQGPGGMELIPNDPATENGKDPAANPYGTNTGETQPETAMQQARAWEREVLARGGIPLEEAILDRIQHPGVRQAVAERIAKNGEAFDAATKPIKDLADPES